MELFSDVIKFYVLWIYFPVEAIWGSPLSPHNYSIKTYYPYLIKPFCTSCNQKY